MREGERSDQAGREMSDEPLRLHQTRVVAVADLVVAATFTHQHTRVLPGLLQLGHPCPGEGGGRGSDDADLEVSWLAGEGAPSLLTPSVTAGVQPRGLAVLGGGPGRAGQTLLPHMNLPLGERLVVNGLQDGLVSRDGGELQQHHMLRVTLLEHSIPSDPPLANFPDLFLGVLPAGEGGEGEGAVGGVQVELVQGQRCSVLVEGLQAGQAAQRSSAVVQSEVSGVENSPLYRLVTVEPLEEEHE